MKLRRRSFLSLALAPVLRGQKASTLDVAGIEKAISMEMSQQSIPGLSAAIGAAGEIRWSGGYGLADLENFVPVKTSTVFRTASIAKPVTATAAMQLVESGRLDLDAPVEKYVPEFPRKPWPVTMRQLLGHLGGIRSYRDDGESFNTHHFSNLRDAVGAFAADDLASEPGTRYAYSSLGFVLAGAVVEAVAGVPFADYLRRYVFEPAGMRSTYVDDVYSLIPNRARGYQKAADGRILNAALLDTSNRLPGGGLASTPGDIVRFVFALPRLVKPESLALMWRPQATRDGVSTDYGLGWGVGEWRGHMRVAHSGSQSGVSTMLWFFPFDRTAVVTMCNLEGVQWPQLLAALSTAALG